MARNDIGGTGIGLISAAQAQGNMRGFQPFAIPGVFNAKPANTTKLGKAKATVRNSLGRPKIGFLGDSTTRGVRSGTGTGGYTGQRLRRHSAVIARALANTGLDANTQSIFGLSDQTEAQTMEEDSRISIGTGWVAYAVAQSLGGQMFRCPSGITTTLTLTTDSSIDTVDVYYVQSGTNGTFTIDVDGDAALATVNSTGSASVQKRTVTPSLGNHAINLKWSSGNDLYIIGIHAYNSTLSEMDFLNFGWGGSTVAQWVSQAQVWNPYGALGSMSLDVAFVNLLINDWRANSGAGTDLATAKASYQTLITRLVGLGADVILCAPAPSNIATPVPLATQQAFISTLYDLAKENDLPLVDFTYRLQSYAVGTALGKYGDGLHPNGCGQADMADPIIRLIQAA